MDVIHIQNFKRITHYLHDVSKSGRRSSTHEFAPPLTRYWSTGNDSGKTF
jgi:hypothetical protein